MSRKIIVAGGGHGGIAAASILAKNGYDVTVVEKDKRENMGYDWTDIFDKKAFSAAEMPMPENNKFKMKENMTFYGPAFSIALHQNTPEDQLEIQMERAEIYNHIVKCAIKNGVKFAFDTAVIGPVMAGNRVIGIDTSKGKLFGDMVIDACGMHSPVRKNLPDYLGIQEDSIEFEQFYVYRAFFNKATDDVKDKFKVCMFNEGLRGISWIATEENHTDVLIGRFEKFDIDEANRTIEHLRQENPSIGNQMVRGGQFVEIPVRQPLGVLVCDGYAAVGDSAFMTVPIIGSGIANSMKAGRILADAILADKDEAYSGSSLWKYQTDFYNELGKGLAPLAVVKLLLTRIDGSTLDYIFETGILNGDDMTIGADSLSIGSMLGSISIDDLKIKAKGLIKNKAVLKQIIRLGKEYVAATAVVSSMPKEYNQAKIVKWVTKYNNCFKH